MKHTNGKALSPLERQHGRFLDALAAFAAPTGMTMVDPPNPDPAAAAEAAAQAAAAAKAAEDKTAADAKAAAAAKAAEDKTADGFPANTPVEQMKPAEQVAYWKHQAQKHEARNKSILTITGGKYGDELKAELAKAEELRKANLTEQEKALEEAKTKGFSEARAEMLPRLATMALNIALDGMPEQDRKELIDTLDLTKFVDAEGNVDTAKVQAVASKLNPGKGKQAQDFGAGRRTGTTGTGVTAGAARFAERQAAKKPGAGIGTQQ